MVGAEQRQPDHASGQQYDRRASGTYCQANQADQSGIGCSRDVNGGKAEFRVKLGRWGIQRAMVDTVLI